MQVRMLANVGLLSEGQEYDLDDTEAQRCISSGNAEPVDANQTSESAVPTETSGQDQPPEADVDTDSPDKPASKRRGKAVRPPENKTGS